mgnify:CR=1 FL=1
MGSKPKLGFLGLGLMGSQMTKRLIKNGYQVTGFDPDPDKMIGAVANGVIAAASPAEVARASDIVQACVINTPALTRSEEHTSELQSQAYPVRRLLLETNNCFKNLTRPCGLTP